MASASLIWFAVCNVKKIMDTNPFAQSLRMRVAGERAIRKKTLTAKEAELKKLKAQLERRDLPSDVQHQNELKYRMVLAEVKAYIARTNVEMRVIKIRLPRPSPRTPGDAGDVDELVDDEEYSQAWVG